MYCRQHFTENYKKMYEIWRRRNPECKIYMDGKKLINQTDLNVTELNHLIYTAATVITEEINGTGE
jgi:hypothetical protein